MLASLLFIPFLSSVTVAAQSVSVVCVAGQCLEGFTNTTLGATLSASGAATSLHLLPGEYSSTTNPELLHGLLTSSSASLSASPGFLVNSTVSLPFDLALQPGIASYPGANFSGQATFTSLPTNVSTTNSSKQLSAGSFALASNTWASFAGAASNDRVIFWDSVSDVSQLPASTVGNPLTLGHVSAQPDSPALPANPARQTSSDLHARPVPQIVNSATMAFRALDNV
ncbi:uncharacterized protein FIBRA_06709 [Fibroporia radiculosa]|uniref:Uncharacterized protein n=1 Tax=Fibroporia radiculosa TaxID=599839 RepID=J4GCA0_9APHY|nr:uncharacterized protein FIBRA_06709 [Fibroporia radiculosa]CCM04528.1 predicted protein [Fibroporia radiculosa]